MPKGYLCLVLHAHLPFVRHPEYEFYLEEQWLFEAISETYIPLIWMFKRLEREKVDFRLTMSMTPPLVSMLMDPHLQDKYLKRLDQLIELCHKEVERTRWQPEFQRLAIMYLNRFCDAKDTFLEYGKNIVQAFKEYQDKGYLEIITCSATHGFFPLMETTRPSVRAQVAVAVGFHSKVFGRAPKGIWLAECGYHPGHDEILREFGIRFFFVESHGILHGTPRPKYGVYAPVYTRSGVAVFGRDMESSKQVWSAVEGYPGDYWYRDFYRDIGYDLDFDYIKPYIQPNGLRMHTGIKYYRITGKTDHKEVYDPDRAMQKAAEHAGNFMFNREKQVEYLSSIMDRKPIIVAPYDAELFGHWWFEGPLWLEFLFKKIHYDQKTIKTITPSEYLNEYPRNQVVTPSFSSWGWKGYCEVWLNGSNDWIYKHLHKASERMTELVKAYGGSAEPRVQRALKQALRELLLAQSSDWAFIMHTGTHVEYAVKRTKEHLLNFNKLYEEIKQGNVDEEFLSSLEEKNNIFPEINPLVHV